MIRDPLRRYMGRHAKMSDYGVAGGGNCNSQTLVMITALQDAEATLPAGQELGVQSFANHLQPVIYDRAKNTTYNLVTGKTKTGVAANIYRPAVILHAYLAAQKRPSPVDPDRDLLIARADPKLARQSPNRNPPNNSNLSFPSSPGSSADGDAPEFALLDDPQFGDEPAAGAAPMSGGKRAERRVGTDGENLFPARLPTQQEIDTSEDDPDPAICPVTLRSLDGREWAVFRDPRLLAQFLAKKTRRDQTTHLRDLILLSFARLHQSPRFRTAIALLKDPKRLGTMTDQDFKGLTSLMDEIRKIKNYPGPARFLSHAETREIEEAPMFRDLLEAAESAATLLTQNPKAWIAWADALPSPAKSRFFEAIEAIKSFNKNLNSMALIPIAESKFHAETEIIKKKLSQAFLWAGDPQHVGVKDESEMKKIRETQLARLREEAANAAERPRVFLWVTKDRAFVREATEAANAAKASPFAPTGSKSISQTPTAGNQRSLGPIPQPRSKPHLRTRSSSRRKPWPS